MKDMGEKLFTTITLTKKVEDNSFSALETSFSFQDLQKDLPVIYQHFCILSYFNRQCQVVIEHRDYPENGMVIDHFRIKGEEKMWYMFRINKDPYRDVTMDGGKLSISYNVSENLGSKEGRKIDVAFRTESTHTGFDYIYIDVSDSDGWITEQFQEVEDKIKFNRYSYVRRMKPNELEYCYKEPRSERTRKISGKHFSIALQGGGVKGIAYIGAYNGLKKEAGNIPIGSIIGSSAGGILGLAICCQMSEQSITNLIVQDLATITYTDQAFKEVDNTDVIKYLTIIKNVLKNYGIIYDDILNIIQDTMADKRFQDCILDLLQLFNPSIKELFSVGPNKDKLSLEGLLKAELMTGGAMRGIGVKAIQSLYENPKFKAKVEPYVKQRGDEWAEKLTLKELYKITEVEFTCTSVDVDSQVLRFFNHKTTPDMPACCSVQLTGSFPVAFKAEKWKKEWGKYYIHYDNVRREVDLTGHQFTDGGMLANFPVKYLDNEKMRPMYFSHPKSEDPENPTIMYGLGLNAIKPPVEMNVADIFAKMKSIGMSHVPKFSSIFGVLWGYLKDPSPVQKKITDKENPLEELKQIPLVSFISRLINTFMFTKDNLTEECFAHRVYETSICKELEQTSKTKNRIPEEIANIKSFVQKFHDLKIVEIEELADDPASIMKTLQQNFDFLQEMIEVKPKTEFNLLEVARILNYMISKYMFVRYTSQTIRDQNIPINKEFSNQFKEEVIKMDYIRHSKIFAFSQIERDYATIRETIQACKKWFSNNQSQKSDESKAMMIALSEVRVEEKNKIEYFYKLLQEYVEEVDGRRDKNCFIPMKQEELTEIMKLNKNSVTTKIESLVGVMDLLNSCNVSQFQISFKAYYRREKIRSYVEMVLEFGKKRNVTDVHLVLECIPLSELYFHEYMTFVLDQLRIYNQSQEAENKMRISSMTGSNFHSIAMFLYASDFPSQKIHNEIWNIRNLVRLNPRMTQEFDSYAWIHNSSQKMRELQDYAWKNKKDIYQLAGIEISDVHSQVNATKDISEQEKIAQSLASRIRDRESEAADSKDVLNESISISIDYVIDAVMNLNPQDKPEKQIQDLAQKIDYNLGKKDEAYRDIHENQSKNMKKLVDFFSDKYLDFIKYLIYSSPMVMEEISLNLTGKEKAEAWKGLIIAEVMSAFKIKSYVCEKLIELGLRPDTTLKEFYDLSEKKITLNFTGIDTAQQFLLILNHNTRPYMPLWAAVVATTSIPEFFKSLPELREWSFMPNTSFSTRETKAYFDPKPYKTGNLISADILTKLPLDLLTNEKIKSLINNKKKVEGEEEKPIDEVFITFNFGDYKLSNIQFSEQIKSKPLSLSQIVQQRNTLSAKMNLACIPIFHEKINRMNIYVNSHDNLISKIYQKELATLPIRMDTLDFGLMTTNGQLSALSSDTIMQSKYVISEKLLNNKKGSQKKFVFFRVENGQNGSLVLRFLAKLNPTNSIVERYRTFYSLSSKDLQNPDNFKEVETEKLNVTFSEEPKFLYLMMRYPQFKNPEDEDTLTCETICHKINLQQLSKMSLANESFGFVYKFNFNQFIDKEISLLPEDENKKVSLNCKSFVGPYMAKNYPFHCDVCYENKGVSLKGNELGSRKGDCFGKNCRSFEKATNFLLKYQCQNCKAKYCPSCKFEPHFKDGEMVCLFGHEIKKTNTRIQHFNATQGGKLKFYQCDFCVNVSISPVEHDSECGIDICDTCRLKLFHEN